MEPPKVMVVDDEPSLVDLVRSYLEAEGFSVPVAYDGLAALQMAAEQQPGVIVLDVMLPGLDGIEVSRRLGHFSSAYVLMLTSRSQEVDKLIGLSVGAVVLTAALSGEIEFFVTLDKAHFLENSKLQNETPFPIGTPGDCLAWLRGQFGPDLTG